jgi:iron complex outermembrane receptor protein
MKKDIHTVRDPHRDGTLVKGLIIATWALLACHFSHAQTVITGTVVDEQNGVAIPGVAVLEKGTLNGVATDADGSFTLTPTRNLPITLVFTFLGYQGREVPVADATPLRVELAASQLQLNEVEITARRRRETAQEVPIPISVIGGALVEEAGTFNVNRLKELVPTVQLYSSNPRNTTLNIRGLGSTFGLTNDGIDPGVGFYVDGVYFARPAVTTLDFIDVERIEVLRGPQGTLFGKNTTAGAFNVITRRPSFTPGANFELSYGNFGFIQAKSSLTGPLGRKLAARFSFSGTQRDGLIENVRTGKAVNDLNNLGVRAQLLYQPSDRIAITFVGDVTSQKPDGYAQVFAGVVRTQRAEFRQFDNIIADLGYELPSRNPFDRKIDHDTPWKSGNELGGVSLNADIELGPGTLTSTTAWRYWNWDPSNDRDFTGLPVLTRSQAPSRHQNWSQEIRYAGNFTERLSGVVGLYAIGQELKTDPVHTEESGSAQWRFIQSNTNPLWETPGLLDGYGINTNARLTSLGGAVFANIDWEVIKHIHILPGIRYNYDEKDVDYKRETFGGLQTDDPALIALQRSVYNDQEFVASAQEENLTGQLTLAYRPGRRWNVFATYSTSFKPVGVNLGGLPNIDGQPALDLAVIRPEYVQHFEVGVKTRPTENTVLNVVAHSTDITDYQTLVQSPQLGVNRGYLANAEEVRVIGVELDASWYVSEQLSFYGAVAWTEGIYVSFTNAPLPLEEVGAPVAFKDISGGDLPGISKWAGSLGGEFVTRGGQFLGKNGKYFVAFDTYYRSAFSSSPSPSQFLNIDGYALLNGRLGFRGKEGLSIFLWGRNLLDKDYFEQLLPAGGNAGHYAGVLGDQRTYGITLRRTF